MNELSSSEQLVVLFESRGKSKRRWVVRFLVGQDNRYMAVKYAWDHNAAIIEAHYE